ncbi:MAG: hypothetical protein IJE96_09130 [Mailhella sp.]|nr:hypothetical protein [Mailhella sp.]
MKKFLTAIVAMLTGVFLAGYDASAEAPLCGGVTDRTDRAAPKVIKSKEITAFSTSFLLRDETSPHEGIEHWSFTVKKEDSGRIAIEAGNGATVQADDALLAELQQVIDRFDLAALNGTDRVIAGLPPMFGPCRMSVDYASGERLYFQRNSRPEEGWPRAMLDIFLNAFDKKR